MTTQSTPRDDEFFDPPLEVVIGTCAGCGSLSVNPSDSEGCCEGIPGLIHVTYAAICGRPLIGQGDDTYDPDCGLRAGHRGVCQP